MGTRFLTEDQTMIATLALAAVLLAQDPPDLDALLSRHQDAARKAKTYDELTAAARATLAEIVKLLGGKIAPETAARARAIASDICADLEDYEGAESHARTFLETWPKHEQAPLIKMNLGQILVAAGRDSAAREAFQSLIRDHPQDTRVFEARLRTAQSFLCEKRDDDALKTLDELRAAFKGKPEEWAAVMQKALFLQIMGKAGEGRALLEETVRSATEPRTLQFAKYVLGTWLWIGKPARPIEGWNLKGDAAGLDLSAGKVTVLYFLGTAHPDFQVDSGVMRRISRRFAGQGVNLLAIAIDKEKAKLESDLALAGVTWPVVFDGNGLKGPIAMSYTVESLPMVLLIDKKSVVRFVNPVFGDHAREIGRCVETLVNEK
jgi:tetratricopeptide (TPR) repeat protein